MRENRITHLLWCTGLACSLLSCRQAGTVKPPNILFIMTDDHARQAIGAYGSAINHTPAIDRLAEQGMLFRNSFVTNSICAPSRAVILTGKFSHINGVLDNTLPFDSTQATFPKILHKAGYQTALFGKWHLKSLPSGFDSWAVLPGQGDYYNPGFITPEGTLTTNGYVTDIITDMAIRWLKDEHRKGKPFLLMVQHKAPHREWWPGPNHLGKYHGSLFPEPPTLFDDYEGRGRAAREQEMSILKNMNDVSDLKIGPEDPDTIYPTDKGTVRLFKRTWARMDSSQKTAWAEVYDPVRENYLENPPEGDELLRWKYQRYLADYLGCIASVDDNVGRILDYLDESGLAENTLVVYTSDQGFYLGEHGWFDKRFMYEESFSTPLIMRKPGLTKPGSECMEMVQNIDLAETFLDIAGVDIPGEMQGISLLPLLKDESRSIPRKALYYHYYEYPAVHMVKRHYGIRTDRYKLIHFYYDIDEWELYDLENDPSELNNLAGNPAYSSIFDSLKLKLQALRTFYLDSDSLDRVFIDQALERRSR